MAKLFPPLIEGAIPAFYPEENGTIKIIVPFSMNRAVGSIQVKGFALKAKTVQSTTYLFTYTQKDINNFNMEDSCYVEFIVSQEDKDKLKKGQFYKFQLAYIDNTDTIGYYSTVGIGKYTTKPEVAIQGLYQNEINTHNYEYMGTYSQENGDVTERVYSYRFDAYDSYNNLIATSGEQLHNSSNDVEINQSYDKFILAQDLEIDKSYYIKYTVNTNNGLTISSPRYRIMSKFSIDPDIKTDLKATLNYENGYIDISLQGHLDDEGLEIPVTGAFLLTRASDDTGYSVWEEISRFKLASQTPSRWLWKDFTTEQGKTYKYALQQYNDKNLYSNKILSNEVYMDFEYAFLFDGEKQLKIKYNPKMTSFKTNLLETKVNTIGAKHPFIFRNGRVDYKEFPISGLISYLMDEENLFMNEEDYLLKEKTTNLISSNLASERIFKMKVLEWLTNGEPKLFRSPTEGNYIVRLMNTSLSPNDTLGRMLHTFTCTAYEIADFTYQNLNNFNFIALKDPEVATLRFETITFDTIKTEGLKVEDYVQVNAHPITTVRVQDIIPGTIIKIWPTDYETDIIEIKIGVTGSYYVDLGVEIVKLEVPVDVVRRNPNTSMTYSFYSISQNTFDKIDNVRVSETPAKQYIGEKDIIKDIEYIYYGNKWKRNPKIDILQFYSIQAQKRSIEKAIYENGVYKSLNGEVLEVDKFSLYAIGKWITEGDKDWDNIHYDDPFKPSDYYRPGYPNRRYLIQYYMDPMNGDQIIPPEKYDSSIYINGNQNSLKETIEFDMSRPGKLKSLMVGNGAMATVSYQIRTTDYAIENDKLWNVHIYKDNYLSLKNELTQLMNQESYSEEAYEQEQKKRNEVNFAYTQYINELIKAQQEERVAEGKI